MELGHGLTGEELHRLIVWGTAGLQFGFTGLLILYAWLKGGFNDDPGPDSVAEGEDQSEASR